MPISNDPFISVITSQLTSFSTTNSLAWTVVAQDSPNRKTWNTSPFVAVVPAPKELYWIAFGITNTIYNYDVYLLSTGNLASNFDNHGQQLYQACLTNYMPLNATITTAGAWSGKVKPKYDYDRSAFPEGWQSSCVTINLWSLN